MKDSEINELESELQEKKDEGLVSEITFEEKMSKGVDIQFDLSVPTEGEHITLSFKSCLESLNDESNPQKFNYLNMITIYIYQRCNRKTLPSKSGLYVLVFRTILNKIIH